MSLSYLNHYLHVYGTELAVAAALCGVGFLFYVLTRYRCRHVRGIKLGSGTGWGTVYIFRDTSEPKIVKVGTTTRKSKERKAEVARVMADGADLKQVYAIDMPFARAVETVAHRRLKRSRVRWWRRRERGREWFKAKGDKGLEKVIRAVEASARDVRRLAKSKRRWPDHGDRATRTWRLSEGDVKRTNPFT